MKLTERYKKIGSYLNDAERFVLNSCLACGPSMGETQLIKMEKKYSKNKTGDEE